MKTTFYLRHMAVLLLAIILLSALVGCGEEPVAPVSSEKVTSAAVSSGDVSSDAASSGAASSGADQTLTVTLQPKNGTAKTETGEGSVSLKADAKYQAGDEITVTLPEGQHYLSLSLYAKGKPAILYLPDGIFRYTIPSDGANYMPPELFRFKNTITASIPASEALGERNLAYNPYDTKKAEATVFPHASSKNQYNTAEFGAHNVLDGCTQNTAHGLYPYQSWGPNETVKKTDYLSVDFGHTVKADRLVLYLRADFSGGHDAYFSEVCVEFSDGSTTVIHPTRTKDAQSFDLGGVQTDFVKLTGFVTDKKKGTWAGYTEVEVYGSEIG